MQRAVKIKKGGSDNANGATAEDAVMTERQRDRETANTIKGWVAELEKRKRSLRMSASKLIRSFESA